jgi:class 3 adenylate cyclase
MAEALPGRVGRRLAAIVAADVAGYSRLMHHDEEATHAKLTALLADAVAPAIADHGGRIVKNTGDGFLAEFPSAVEAVRAAMQFQTRINDLTIGDAEDERIAFRVGINIGDIIVEPHDIFGDGVNIAARLEGIAEPGGIWISSAAHDQVRGKVGAQFAVTKRAAQGIAECEQALALDRNLARAHSFIGIAKVLLGRSAETETHMNEALRLSPRDTMAYRWMVWVGIAKVHLDADAEALVWLRRGLDANRNYSASHFLLAAALARLGELDEARAVVQAGLALDPSFTIRRFRDATNARSDNSTFRAGCERTIEGMHMAGVPEG